MKAAISYKPLAFAQVPGWDQDDHAAAFKAFLKSCERVIAAARERTAADKAPPPPAALVAACAAASRLAGACRARPRAKAFFEQHFTANAVAHQGPRGLLTGYYEPLLQGSRTPQGAFQTPIYKRPPDLVNLVDETQRGTVGTALTPRPQDRQGHRALPHPRRRSSRARSRAAISSCSIWPIRSRCSSCRCRGRGASS